MGRRGFVWTTIQAKGFMSTRKTLRARRANKKWSTRSSYPRAGWTKRPSAPGSASARAECSFTGTGGRADTTSRKKSLKRNRRSTDSTGAADRASPRQRLSLLFKSVVYTSLKRQRRPFARQHYCGKPACCKYSFRKEPRALALAYFS